MLAYRSLLTMPVVLAAACDPGVIGGGVAAPSEPVPLGQIEVRYDGSDEDFPNPERGLFTIGNLVSGDDFTATPEAGSTVSYVVVRLDDYRASALPADFLETLDDGFDLARAAGVKILLRFVYNFDTSGTDAPRDVMLGHLDQLAPVLAANEDILVALQAGMIGAWGEWHSSSNGLDNPADRKAIVEAMLEAVPTRAIMLRSPMLKDENWPGPASTADAFSTGAARRIGHHNDCFLASDDDLGTYADPIDEWKDYVAQDGLVLPVAGETCRLAPPRSDCASAVDEMADLHWSLLSRGGSRDVWQSWRDGGCDDEIARRLGYRFRLVRAVHSEEVAPGGVLSLAVEVHNDGFASPYNPRPLFAVLEGGGRRLAAPLAVDPRRWAAGETTRVEVDLRIPADLAAGDYRLALWLPDEAEGLRDVPAYSIRFANDEVWDAASATNTLATVVIDPSAPGPVDPTATDLAALP